MANINALIEEIREKNPEWARELQKYVKTHSYGLVYEKNLPDAIRLYKKTPSINDTVNILPERGRTETEENSVPWVVKDIIDDIAVIEHGDEIKRIPISEIVTLVGYKDTIYPGLKEIDRIENGDPEDPYHMVINSENYHALEALSYAYAGKVDCIYIDPPYNTGAKDWKYNNDYVVETDQYRHSKWLSFIERRLRLAKQLLNPEDSVLIVTIDEKEYLRLGMLLEQVFPEARIQMISTIINPTGTKRADEFSRTNEFIFFVRIGQCSIEQIADVKTVSSNSEVHWEPLRRHTASNIRDAQHPNQFFPLFIDVRDNHIAEIGECLPYGVDISTVKPHINCETVWPIRDDGREMMWGLKRDTFINRLNSGFVKIGRHTPSKPQKYSISYLASGTIKDIESGKAIVSGHDEHGAVKAYYIEGKKAIPTTQWSESTHDSKVYGTLLLQQILPDREFPFPKSIYAVKDCLSLFVANKPTALVVDFFAGSGTTLHAVSLLNAVDGGRRRCICITNNEVSADESTQLSVKGLRPSDPEWERFGIAHHITWPRACCAIQGIDIYGNPLQGEYMGTNIPMSEGLRENALFCELTYESAWPIRLDKAFDAIAPILWMQAGCRGPIIKKVGKSFLATDYYAVLFDFNQASKFCDKIKNTPTIKHAFIVTDDQRRYSNICKRLPDVEVHRLYETYLRTFEICGEGGLD